MGLKKKSKVSAQFNMSSLTDIIFLLLIFFMLTSTLVAPNALNLKLPGKSTASSSFDDPDDVRISSSGTFYFNGNKVGSSTLKSSLGKLRGKDISISPEKGAPVEKVVEVMDIAMRYKINAILASTAD